MKADGPTFDRSYRKRCFVQPVSQSQAARFIRAHYLKKWPGVEVLTLGLFDEIWLKGCIVFALPPPETSKRYGGTTWELARLFIDDEMPRNSETWLIAKAIKFIRRNHADVRFIVSYADPSVGHEGTIYRAANFIADGRTDDERKTPRFDLVSSSGKKYGRASHVPAGVAVERLPRVSKVPIRLRNHKKEGTVKKLSRKQREIEARRASDPIAQALGRTDIDHENPDELPTAPRVSVPIVASEPCHRCGGSGNDPEHAGPCAECWAVNSNAREYDVIGDGLYAKLCQLFDERAIKLHKTPGGFTHQLALVAAEFTRQQIITLQSEIARLNRFIADMESQKR